MLPILGTNFLLSTLIIVLIVSLFLVKQRKKLKSSAQKVLPGPPKLPFIGNIHQLTGPLPPHHAITSLASKYGPVMHLQLGEMFIVVISSAEAAKEVLKTNELYFAQRPQVLAGEIMSYDNSSIVFAPYGDYWRQMRKFWVYQLLNTKRVSSFRQIREEEVWNIMKSISSSEGVAVNLSEIIFSMTNNITSRAAFNQRCKDQAEFLALLAETIRLSGGFNLPDLYPSLRFLRYATRIQTALQKVKKRIDKILDNVIEEHKEKRKLSTPNDEEDDQEDAIDVLLKLQESNDLEMHLTDNTIKGFILEIFGAGSETTATTMEWAMSELLKNPRVMAKAQNEVRQSLKGKTKVQQADIENLDYLKLVVKETLRMHPPAPLLAREARETCEIFGYKIPAKAKVLINVWAIGKDPNIWTEPNCFKPERFQNSSIDFKGTHFELLPFGAGRRSCPGIPFATSNIELTIAQLLYHFDWTLAGGTNPEELDMSETFGSAARKKHNLSLVPSVFVPFIG